MGRPRLWPGLGCGLVSYPGLWGRPKVSGSSGRPSVSNRGLVRRPGHNPCRPIVLETLLRSVAQLSAGTKSDEIVDDTPSPRVYFQGVKLNYPPSTSLRTRLLSHPRNGSCFQSPVAPGKTPATA